MTSLADVLLSSTGAIVALAIAASWLSVRPQSRAARRFLTVVALLYSLASIYAIPHAVARVALLRGFHPFTVTDLPRGRTAIVVLGGGAQTVRGWEGQFSALSGDGLERVLEAARVYRLTQAEWVITSGGVLASPKPKEPNALIMRDGLVRLGVPEARIVVEPDSRTTHEQFLRIAPILRSLGAEQVVLVTSGIHMRRSLGVFQAGNVRVISAIAPESTPETLWGWVIPSSQGLGVSRQVVHELLGIAYYAARGWWRL